MLHCYHLKAPSSILLESPRHCWTWYVLTRSSLFDTCLLGPVSWFKGKLSTANCTVLGQTRQMTLGLMGRGAGNEVNIHNSKWNIEWICYGMALKVGNKGPSQKIVRLGPYHGVYSGIPWDNLRHLRLWVWTTLWLAEITILKGYSFVLLLNVSPWSPPPPDHQNILKINVRPVSSLLAVHLEVALFAVWNRC